MKMANVVKQTESQQKHPIWLETELENGSVPFLKSMVSLPERAVVVKNELVSVGGRDYSVESQFFQKLISTGLIKSNEDGTGYVVTEEGVSFVGIRA